jgi:hypothetical protein
MTSLQLALIAKLSVGLNDVIMTPHTGSYYTSVGHGDVTTTDTGICVTSVNHDVVVRPTLLLYDNVRHAT